MTADLRAALREALQMAADALPLIPESSVREQFASLVALADAPPTVADLIGQAVGGRVVEWVHVDPATAETTAMRAEWEGADDGMHLCVSFYADDGTYCEGDADLMPSDLTQPATLVEVAP